MKVPFLKAITGACSILPWIFASIFAAKWLGHMASETISYGSESSGVFLQGLCIAAFVGLALASLLAAMSFKWKIHIIWQAIFFVAGLLSFFSIVGD